MKPTLPAITVCFLLIASILLTTSCQNKELKVVTVTGEIPASKIGITLTHEHVLVDFVMIDSISPNNYHKDSVIAKVLPYFMQLIPYKVATFVDCTPEYLGRDPQLLAELSRKTGINILTNTGWYAADNMRHIPKAISNMSAKEIAAMWIGEAKNGIGNTGIRPGFIKIGISNYKLSDTDKKLVSAACLTHLETGLIIMSHTGPAEAALAQLNILKDYGIDPSAFIWTHAMAEPSMDKILTVAQTGCWVSLDGIDEKTASKILVKSILKFMKSGHQLNHVLLSHDAGWYQPDKPQGGEFRPYITLFNSLTPILISEEFTNEELTRMIAKNPAEAFAVRVRRL
jgi:phosphotriesterase-related protein